MSDFDPFIRLPRARIVRERHPFLIDRCRDRRVLHIGCVDHPLTQQRLDDGALLHTRVVAVATEAVGVDIDAEGIDFLRTRGVPDLHVADVCDPGWTTTLPHGSFDIVLASEVIEHLSDPGRFLDSVRDLVVAGADLIVTVPNAFRLETLRYMLRGIELVHPDHNYWFSYHTITTLLAKHGYTAVEVLVYSFVEPRLLPRLRRASGASASAPDDGGGATATGSRARGYLRSLPVRVAARWLYRRTPFWGDGIIVVARAP